jgi:ubiquitin-protein ligase E3 B
MYEQQRPFQLTDYVHMSSFLNQFLYKGVLGNLFGKLVPSVDTVNGSSRGELVTNCA